MGSKFVNNWDSNISVGVLSTDTIINVPIADALKLPTLSAGDYIILTIPCVGATPDQNSWEVIKVTYVNTTTGDLTCVRGFEGTTAKDYLANNAISMDITAGELNIIKTDTAQNTSDITTLQNTKVASVVSGTGILVDNTDPLNPVLSTIPVSAAGLLNRLIATGDATTLSAGTFYLIKAGDKGTTALVSQTVAVEDNQKLYFAQDFVTDAMPSDTVYYGGTYSGSVSVSTSDISELIKYTVEVYLTDTNGTPIDSGLASEVIGDLGVKPLTVLSSGNTNLSTTGTTNLQISGSLSQNFTVTTGQRVRFHISAEKVGINGGIFTLALYTGYDVNSYVDVSVAIKASSVINDTNVIGSTLLDVVNSLKTSVDQYTASDVLAKLLTVDGSGSGLDADTIDGIDSIGFAHSNDKFNLDLNTITQSGMYRLDTTNPNMPTGVSWGQLLVIHGASDTIAQMVFDYSGVNVMWRSGNSPDVGGTGTWTPWYSIWHQNNDGSGSGLDADLLDGLDSTYFAPKNSPSLTGTPTVPTAALGTNTAQIASTAFVLENAVSNPEPSGTNYTYNTDGTVNEITETLPSGSQVSTLSYTTEGKVNTIVVTLNGTTKTYTYSYNAEGKVSGITKS